LDDGFAGFVFGFGFVGDGDAVAEDVHADAFDVLGRDVATAFEEGVGFGGEGEGDGGARAGAELDEVFNSDFVVVGGARGADNVDDVVLHFFVDVDFVDDFARVH